MQRKAVILSIGNKLSKHGLITTFNELMNPELETLGYTVYSFSDKKNKILRLADMILNIIKYSRKADIMLIETFSSQAFWYAYISSLFARLFGLKYIAIMRGGNFKGRMKNTAAITKSYLHNARAIVSPSKFLYTTLAEEGYMPHYIPNFLNLDKYIFKHRRDLKPKILWVRSFHKIYNCNMAIDVLKILKEKYPDAILTMVGPDKDGSMKTAKAYAKKLGLQNDVTFTGKLTKEVWIKLAEDFDIFINTTNYDNHPVSVIEAMSLGLPIVTTNVGGIPFLVEDKKEALLVEKGDYRAMAEAVISLIQNPEKTQALVLAARKEVENFEQKNVLPQWEQLFNEIISGK